MTMTQRINALLAEKGIGKYDFYRACRISSGAFSMWHTGRTVPSKKSLEAIADYLNTTVEYLLTGKGPKEKPASQKEDGLTEAQASVLRLFDSLTEQEQRALLAMARGLIASRQDPDTF